MSLEKVRLIVNSELTACFHEDICCESDAAPFYHVVQNADDLLKPELKQIANFKIYSMDTICNLWIDIKNATDLKTAINRIINLHTELARKHPQPTTSYQYISVLEKRLISGLNKFVQQNVLDDETLKTVLSRLEAFKEEPAVQMFFSTETEFLQFFQSISAERKYVESPTNTRKMA